jgi:beta-carotene 3-hydroxylase
VKGIKRAHKIHHKNIGKYDGENFGMLIVPFKYFKGN